VSAGSEKKTPTIRNSTGIVIIVLCVIAMLAIVQYLTQGRLWRDPSPQVAVRDYVLANANDPKSVEFIHLYPPVEIRSPFHEDVATLVRVKFRLRRDTDQWSNFDKGYFVIGGEVKSSEDWSPELEARIATLLEKYKKK
jgi:hypothetical protein